MQTITGQPRPGVLLPIVRVHDWRKIDRAPRRTKLGHLYIWVLGSGVSATKSFLLHPDNEVHPLRQVTTACPP